MSITNGFETGLPWLRRPAAVLRQLLGQGSSPRRLALSVAIGITVGLAPLIWGTSLLCILLAWRLRLNPVAMQIGNCVCYPLQIALFVPFLLAGQKLSLATSTFPPELWQTALAGGPEMFIRSFWQANLYALGIWFLLSPLCLVVSYLSLQVVLKRWTSRSS